MWQRARARHAAEACRAMRHECALPWTTLPTAAGAPKWLCPPPRPAPQPLPPPANLRAHARAHLLLPSAVRSATFASSPSTTD